MCGAARFDDGVDRQRQTLGLQVLLQQRLAVLAERFRIDRLQHRFEQPRDHVARALESAVDEHRAENRLDRIGQDRRAAETAALHLALPESKKVAQP